MSYTQPYLRSLCKEQENVKWKTFLEASTDRDLQHAIAKHATTWHFVHPGVVSATGLIVLTQNSDFYRLTRCDVLLLVYMKMNSLAKRLHQFGCVNVKYFQRYIKKQSGFEIFLFHLQFPGNYITDTDILWSDLCRS